MNTWNSTKDALPKSINGHSDPVLINWVYMIFKGMAVACYNSEKCEWYDLLDNKTYTGVTHWADLPCSPVI